MFFRDRFHPWRSAAGKVLAAAAVLFALANAAFCTGQQAAAKVMDETTPSNEPYRGFTVVNLDPDLLNDAATKWHANLVRYMMKPHFQGQAYCHCSDAEAWSNMLRDLPAELDTAKKLHMVVVLAMFQFPTLHYPRSKDEVSAFWDDENNLKAMTQAWTQIAEICADRNQVIWFDLLNEPLNWNDMPGYPRKWPVWAQSLIDSIRQIDQNHQIVIEPGPGGMASGFKNFPKLKGEGLIYSFHQYQPQIYTMQGIQNTTGTDLAHAFMPREVPWPFSSPMPGGASWDRERLAASMQPAVDFQKRYGVRMYVGEFSVARWAPNAADWLTDNLKIFEQHGWDWSYHAFREDKIWSLEHSNDKQDPKDLKNTGQSTDRGQVLLNYLSRNTSER